MDNKTKISEYNSLKNLVSRLRDEFNSNNDKSNDFVLLFAYNGTGKTRLSMAFKDKGKQKNDGNPDTLYFNAYTEDLFYWDNDLDNDKERILKINSSSKFFNGLKDTSLEEKIFVYLERYAEFDFKIDYENWNVIFSKKIKNPQFRKESHEPETIVQDYIKISRGEENLFIWCFFLAVCELTIDGSESYNWVKYFYIDDPVSSLDDNNAIALASDLAKLLKRENNKVKTVISSHHSLFFNVICNELKGKKSTQFFLQKKSSDEYTLRKTDDTPSFHHIAILIKLKQAVESGNIYTYHFNMLRSIMEKTATFFGLDGFGKCIHGIEDEVLYSRALNLLSHGKYSLYEPVEMGEDNKKLFRKILSAFLGKYEFNLQDTPNEAKTNQG